MTEPANAAASAAGELPEQQQVQQQEQLQQQQEQQLQQEPLMPGPCTASAGEATTTSSSTPKTFNAMMQMAHLMRQSSPASVSASMATQPEPVGQLSAGLPASATGLPQMGIPNMAAESQGNLQSVGANSFDVTQLRALGLIPAGAYIGLLKFFNAGKGYGFITSSSLSRDVHFKAIDMPPELQSCTAAELAGKPVIFQVEVLKDGKLRGMQLQLATFLDQPQVAQQLAQLSVPAAATAMDVGITSAGAGGGASPQETDAKLQGFVTTYDAATGTGILQVPGVVDVLGFSGFGVGLAPGQHVCFLLHCYPDGTAEARDVAPVGPVAPVAPVEPVPTFPQNNELFNGDAGLIGNINVPNQELGQDMSFQGQALADGMCLQGDVNVAVADNKRSAAAALDPTQLLAEAPPLKQQHFDLSQALPGMTAMEGACSGMTAMEGACSGMTAMEGACSGMTAMEGSMQGMAPMDVPNAASIEATIDANIDARLASMEAMEEMPEMEDELPGMTAMEGALPGTAAMQGALPGTADMDGTIDARLASMAAMQLLPGMTAMEGGIDARLASMAAMQLLPGMTGMEALSGMAAGAPQAGAFSLTPTGPADMTNLVAGACPAAMTNLVAGACPAAMTNLVAGACPAVVSPGLMTVTSEQASARLAGVVKSFNAAKGFGFISCQGLAEDIFFLRSELPGGLATGHTEPGQIVSFEIQLTPDGRYRANRISQERSTATS